MNAAATKLSWQEFVLTAPRSTRVADLAAVVGAQPSEVRLLRTGAPVGPGTRPRATFGELFAQWNGRPPEDHEWPVPTCVGRGGTYEWHAPEEALLASLVGQQDPTAIAAVLTARLRAITGDATAERSRASILVRMNRLGLMTTDLLGGLSVADAGREYGGVNVVRDAIERGEMQTRRVGRLVVIPHAEWQRWLAGRRPPPEGFVQLTTLKEPLGIRSDKLPEFARMGYVPEAVLCHPGRGQHSGARGTWFIPPDVAERLKADRRAGRPMPWHGMPLLDNLKQTWAKWQQRKHPATCATCSQIWGEAGAPADFEAFVKRYPPLEHGAKRHLTMNWCPGLSVTELAATSGRSASHVALAIRNGQVAATTHGRAKYIAKADGTRWIAAGSPCGERVNDWLALDTATKRYGFSRAELLAMVADGRLRSRLAPAGPRAKEQQVPWRQVAKLRETLGFSESEAAAKVGVTVEEFQRLAEGTNWRGQVGIPLATVQAIIKRVKSESGYTVTEAADAVGRSIGWVKARIADGTVVLYSRPWTDRTYITELGLADLRRAATTIRVASLPAGEWISAIQAAELAAVSVATLQRWSDEGVIRSMAFPQGRRHEAESVKAQARRYWDTVRFVRDRRPAWLKAERPIYAKRTQSRQNP